VATVVLFNKPYDVLTQFRPDGDRRTLAEFIDDKSLRVAGRLDRDSEGLLLLTNDGKLNAYLTDPRYKELKTYWVQVDGDPSEAALEQLRQGVMLNDGITLPAIVRRLEAEPSLWPRQPPVRFRANIPTTWLEIQIREGRNRQVRRMTAVINHPTLRLVRMAIGPYQLGDLSSGCSSIISVDDSPSVNNGDETCSGAKRDLPATSRRPSGPRSRNNRRNNLPIGPRGK
jgi:23S rRNA pseudouridine2457 synthase